MNRPCVTALLPRGILIGNNSIYINMYNYFFHSLKWDNDVYVMYIVWAILIPVLFFLIRFIYKSIRKPRLRSKNAEYYTVRDLFMEITSQEYLIVFVFLFAIYLGIWAYLVAPFSQAQKDAWSDWHTYLIVLPQIVTLIAIAVLFFVRNNKFSRKFRR